MSEKGRQLDHYIETEDFKSKRPSMAVVRRVLADLFDERGVFTAGAVLILTGTAATLTEPRLFGYAIDHAIVPGDLELVKWVAFAYLAVTATRVLSVIGQSFLFEKLAQRMMDRLRVRLFGHLQVLPVATYDLTPVGRLITRLTNDTSAMSEMFSAGFVTLFGNILFIFGTIVWILLLNWKLALIAISVFPVLVYFATRFSRRLITAYRNSRMRISALNAFLAENILGMKVVHLFNRERLHFHRFREVNDSYAESQISAVRVYAHFQPLITWCSGLGVALVLAFGGRMALEGELTRGELVAFITYLPPLSTPVREVVDRWTIFLSGMTSAERIYSLLDWPAEQTVADSERRIERRDRAPGAIEFENVWFAYDGENWVLRDFSLKIDPGQKIGIVGHTGAGKSTVISLLLRFYEPNRGRILLDGKDIREIPKRELRERVGLIQQDVFLFSGRISENIHLWSREGDEISAPAAKALRELGFKHELGKPLEERGSNLSMGERQLLAFTRALEGDPDLWILDEATANVDSDSEEKLGRALEEAAVGRTLIMIAHRLATIRRADQILVLHKGALVEKGDHEALLKLNGYYSRLYRYQSAMERSTIQETGAPQPSPV